MRRATLVGGPRDGETVAILGPVLFEPGRLQRTYFALAQEHEPLPPPNYPTRAYDLRQDQDHRCFYVLRDGHGAL